MDYQTLFSYPSKRQITSFSEMKRYLNYKKTIWFFVDDGYGRLHLKDDKIHMNVFGKNHDDSQICSSIIESLDELFEDLHDSFFILTKKNKIA